MTNNLLLLCLFFSFNLIGQSDELPFIKTQDLSYLLTGDSIDQIIYDEEEWETTFRPEPIGYIGKTYKRLRIHFSEVRKSDTNPLLYEVTGKTKVKDNICDFTGTITITAAQLDTSEDFPDEQQGIVSGIFHFEEDAQQKGTGTFQGKFWSRYWLPHGKRVPPLAASGPTRSFDNPAEIVVYNSLGMEFPDFGNNQFNGSWISYRTGKEQPLAWADFRFSYPTDLDIGASEFSPAPEFHDHGWRTYSQAWIHADSKAEQKRAIEIETSEWWK